jgi:hypothetical protein
MEKLDVRSTSPRAEREAVGTDARTSCGVSEFLDELARSRHRR